MQSKLNSKLILVSACLLAILISGCLFGQAAVVSTDTPSTSPTESPSTEAPSPTMLPAPIDPLEVVFVNNGNLLVWDAATQQTRTIVNTGDVNSATVSDDGQAIAFTRRSWVGDVVEGYEQYALWTVDRDGGNPRELVSAQDLRQRVSPSDRESSNFYQLGWVPNSHQLIFSGTKYIVQAEGLSHAIPQGAFLVDTDSGSVSVLAEAGENLRFLPSPDGKQVALMSPSSLGFINIDGSNKRQDVLTYTEVGLTGPLFPTGVWTQDSRAFVMTGSFERDLEFNTNFSFLRVPLDGSSPEALAAVTSSQPGSVTFSPDGKSASYIQWTNQQSSSNAEWFITSLIPETGALTLPNYGMVNSYANLHWSPAGDAYAINDQGLARLCPNATKDSQVCGEPIPLGDGIITELQWVDASRFIFESIEPYSLSLGNIDGTLTPIVTGSDKLSDWDFINTN